MTQGVLLARSLVGKGGVGHCSGQEVVNDLLGIGAVKTEEILVKAFIVVVEDFEWRGQFGRQVRG